MMRGKKRKRRKGKNAQVRRAWFCTVGNSDEARRFAALVWLLAESGITCALETDEAGEAEVTLDFPGHVLGFCGANIAAGICQNGKFKARGYGEHKSPY